MTKHIETSVPAIVLTSIEITVFQAKGTVESIVRHEPMTMNLNEYETDGKVTHRARRFERAAACPVATGHALLEHARRAHPSVPSSLRFA